MGNQPHMANTEFILISRDEYNACKSLQQENAELKEQNKALKTYCESLKDFSAYLCRIVFGRSSEKTEYLPEDEHVSEEPEEQTLSNLGDYAAAIDEMDCDCDECAEEQAVESKPLATKRKTLRSAIKEAEPIECIEYKLHKSQLICPQCGKPLVRVGCVTKRELHVIPARFGVREYRRTRYICQDCKKHYRPAVFKEAPAKPSVLPHSNVSPHLIVHIAVQKFQMGNPLYRQERVFAVNKFPLKRQGMSKCLIDAHKLYISPVVDAIYKHLLERQVLHTDETPLRVLHDENHNVDHSNSYMWLYRTGNDGKEPCVIYEFCKNHRADNVLEFLKGYSGYLHADGYKAYHKLPAEIIVVGCWAHLRRKFELAYRRSHCKPGVLNVAGIGLRLCNKLFEIERKIKGLPPDYLLRQRKQKAKPILDMLYKLAEENKNIPHEATRRAVRYLLDQWQYLIRYLDDGRLEISNNRAERSIKTFVINRKNFLFSNSPSGAEASAGWMTMIVTASEMGLDPYKYLVWLLERAPEAAKKNKNWAEDFLPWKAPEECRVK